MIHAFLSIARILVLCFPNYENIQLDWTPMHMHRMDYKFLPFFIREFLLLFWILLVLATNSFHLCIFLIVIWNIIGNRSTFPVLCAFSCNWSRTIGYDLLLLCFISLCLAIVIWRTYQVNFDTNSSFILCVLRLYIVFH